MARLTKSAEREAPAEEKRNEVRYVKFIAVLARNAFETWERTALAPMNSAEQRAALEVHASRTCAIA